MIVNKSYVGNHNHLSSTVMPDPMFLPQLSRTASFQWEIGAYALRMPSVLWMFLDCLESRSYVTHLMGM